MLIAIRTSLLTLIFGGVVYVVLDKGSLSSVLTLLGILVGLFSTYIGERTGEIKIAVRVDSPAIFYFWNSGTKPLRGVKIVAPAVHVALQRDLNEFPSVFPPTKKFQVSAGLSRASDAEADFEASWRAGLLTNKTRKIKPTRL